MTGVAAERPHQFMAAFDQRRFGDRFRVRRALMLEVPSGNRFQRKLIAGPVERELKRDAGLVGCGLVGGGLVGGGLVGGGLVGGWGACRRCLGNRWRFVVDRQRVAVEGERQGFADRPLGLR